MDLTVSNSPVANDISDATVSSSEQPGETDTLSPKQREDGRECVLPSQKPKEEGEQEMGLPNTWPDEEPFAATHCAVLDYWNLPDPPREFDQMPVLESQPSTAHFSSPIHNTLSENILQEDDMQDKKGVGNIRGICGLRNLGNTCFMNAGLQCLLNNPSCVRFFVESYESDESTKDTMASKFADLVTKVWSGLYSTAQPVEFKEVLAKHHPQFRDYRQHDCQEFLALLLDTLHEQLNTGCNKSCDNSSVVNSVTSADDKTVEVDFEETHPSLTATEEELDEDIKNTKGVTPEFPAMDADREESRENVNTLVRTPQQILSENSSHSASPHSTDSFNSWDMNMFRLYPVPEDVKPFKDPQRTMYSSDGEVCESPNNIEEQKNLLSPEDLQRKQRNQACPVENIVRKPEKNEIANKLNTIRKIPTIEDFVKETKTLNTNVLVADEPNNQLKFDSEKFPKLEPSRPQETLDNLSELNALGPVKNYPLKRVKDTNLRQEKQSNCSESNVQQAVVAKRMKIEDKNSIQDQMDIESAVLDDSEMSSTSDQQDTPVPDELDADNEWEKYQAKNQSVVVDTFQGQFRSTVVCAECCHVSVTYEPFMYLPVPLPYALERQVVVRYVPFGGKQPLRHLVTLNKNDKVHRLKELLLNTLALSEEAPQDIILAEVFGSHISKILDDNVQVRYLNLVDRELYAFEVSPIQLKDPPPSPPGATLKNLQTSSSFSNEGTFFLPAEPKQEGSFENGVSSSEDTNGMSSSTAPFTFPISTVAIPLPAPPSITEAISAASTTIAPAAATGRPWEFGDATITTDDRVSSTTMDYGPSTSGASAETTSSAAYNCGDGADLGAITSSCSNSIMASSSNIPLDQWQRKPICAGWQTCAICLEEMPNSNLRVHRSCQCLLCCECVERSCKHYGSNAFTCPVCGEAVKQEEFLPLSVIEEFKTNMRNLPLPVVFRLSLKAGEGSAVEESHRLVGHPALLQVPGALPASSLYEWVDKCVPFPAPFSLCFVDGQGLNCSRCMYSQRCRGCEVAREGDVSLLPSDSLAVCFEEELLTDHLSTPPLDHKSMSLQRNAQALSLYDCLQAFSESETLDEQNPWYCPVCQRHQQARKSLSIWRCPDILMVYLKRFMFHEFSSTKVDDKVQFPLEGLDLSPFVSGPTSPENVVYDLQACVCHFGGVSSGHYTAYSKHAVSGEWFNFNDESTRKLKPQEEDHTQAYILFYQRPGLQLPPSFPKCGSSVLFEKSDISPDEGSCSSEPRLKQDTLNSILKQLEDSCPDELDVTTMDPLEN